MEKNIKYYYCNYDVFQSIITNKKIWLTSIWDLNDTSEISWLYKEVWPAAYDHLLKNVDETELELLQLIKHEIDCKIYNVNKYFIMCFSDYKDLLSQWRGYADDGKGFSIGFDLNKISNLNTVPSSNIDFEKSFGYSKVIYDDNFHFNRLIEIFYQTREVADYPKIIHLVHNYNLHSLIFKNPYYFEERETRLIFSGIIENGRLSNLGTSGKIVGPFFHRNNYGLTTHLEVDLLKCHESSCIEEIVLGPKNSTTIDAIEEYLRFNNLENIIVSKSLGTYR